MNKFKNRLMAWAMLLVFLLVSTVGTVTYASDTVTKSVDIAENPLEVSQEEIASGKVLYLTSEMIGENGNLIIQDGSWEKIIITKEVNAEKIILQNVTATELVVESGSDCLICVENATLISVTVIEPQLEEVGYEEICSMLSSGMDASEVVSIYNSYLQTKAELEKTPISITTGAGATIQALKVGGNSKLDLAKGQVEEVKINASGINSILKVSVIEYNGKVSVEQNKEDGYWNIVNLEVKDSVLTELDISGDGTCTVQKNGNSKVEKVSVGGSSDVLLYVPADEVTVEETSENVSLKLYSDVGELSAAGDNIKIAVSSSATIGNQENVSGNVKVSAIKNNVTTSSSKPKAKATPTPEPVEPEVTPEVTPEPEVTPGAGEDGPSDFPEVNPGEGDESTGSTTGGALVTPTPDDEEEETEPEYTPEDWFNWYEEDGCVIITGFSIPWDEETDEQMEFDGVVVVPETIDDMPVTGIESAFTDSEITEVILPESLVSIADGSFEGSSIESIVIPAGVEEISEYAFTYAEYLAEILVDEENENYSSIDGCLYDKDVTTLIQVPMACPITYFEVPEGVETISETAFEGGSSIEVLVLSSTVSDFDAICIASCVYLEDVEVTEDNPYFEDYGDYILTEDGTGVVHVNPGVSEFEIPNTLTDINLSAFRYSGCLPMTSFTVETGNNAYCVVNGILYTKDMTELVAYTEAAGLWQVNVPTTVTRIGTAAFYNTAVGRVVLTENVKAIESYAFGRCENLFEITGTDGLLSIGSNAFWRCSNLDNVYLPYYMDTIGNGAFRSCESLHILELPDTVAKFGSNVVADCTSLEELYIPYGITTLSLSSLCDGCTSLISIYIPDSVTRISGSIILRRCPFLEYIYIPDSVTSIGRILFGTGEEYVTIVTSNDYVIERLENYGYNVQYGYNVR